MNLSISRRSLVRILSFCAAALLVMLGLAIRQNAAAEDYRRQLEIGYARSLGELSSYLVNIADDLDKGRYVGTPASLAQLSARIWRESGGAKEALSSLPVGELHMDNTYRFLSQVGDYAMALSKKVASGQELTGEERQNAEALREYAGRLRDYVDGLLGQIRDGSLEVSALRAAAGEEQAAEAGLYAGFEDVEQTMTGYPTLIYDGPFSDHLPDRMPKYTRQLPAVTPEDAQKLAAKAARLNATDLTRGDDENSNMPCYTFQSGTASVAVTKAGGLTAWLLNGREVGEERLNRQAIFQRAEGFLEEQGYQELRASYYETNDGICTINYAATQGDVLCYPDLVKVGVALDDGSIVFYDARGYLMNHYDRELGEPALTVQEAAASLNPALTVLSHQLALIPTAGQNEALTYEFHVSAPDGGSGTQELLVYVNASTGAEEQILMLIETPYGTLTK